RALSRVQAKREDGKDVRSECLFTTIAQLLHTSPPVPETAMLHVALWEPEIPPNTGNIARLCAATGAELHLIGRLGFRLDDRSLRRAGVDYWSAITFHRHATFDEFHAAVIGPQAARLFCFSAAAEQPYTAVRYQD